MWGNRDTIKSFNTGDVPYSGGDDDGASTDGSTGTWASSKLKEIPREKSTFSLGPEARGVRLWRAAVIISLVVMTASISVAMWFLLSQQQESTYQAAYAVVTRTIKASSTEQVLKLHESMKALSDIYTATAIAENLTWPFVGVTRQPFEVLGHQARLQSGVEFIMVAPFVSEEQRRDWVAYSVANGWWYDQSKAVYEMLSDSPTPRTYAQGSMAQELINKAGLSPVLNGTDKHCPIWQASPPPYIPQAINYDMIGEAWYGPMIPALERLRTGLFSNVFDLSAGSGLVGTEEDHLRYHQDFSSSLLSGNESNARPHGVFVVPIFEAYQDKTSEMVGLVTSIMAWDRYLVNLVPESITGVMVVLENTCNQSYTFMLNGTKAQYMGTDDYLNLTFQESRYNVSLGFLDSSYGAVNDWTDAGHCIYSLQVYSTQEFKTSVSSNTAFVFTLLSAGVGLLVIMTFLLYDCYVRRRNAKMVDAAARRDEILMSLFPSTVRSRLLEEQEHTSKKGTGSGGAMVHHRLRNFLSGADGTAESSEKVSPATDSDGYEGKPIADLFPEATVLCADISGFTAWASIRQPSQVFTLLESIYKEFDAMANKRKVFKVETVGDCYVAVAGLPDPRKDHAVMMARFANDCVNKMIKLVEILEVSLGPDTADLSLRVGIHSGPVTAGVLRGERSRFQLFGDTMNTASRMESSGVKGRIQCSQDTADLLIAAGKERWLDPRQDYVKVKGGLQTYWLNTNGSNACVEFDMIGGAPPLFDGLPQDKGRRLINWNVDNLLQLLKQIAATRRSKPGKRASKVAFDEKKVMLAQSEPGKSVIDEVKEIINLPDYTARHKSDTTSLELVVLPQPVVDQLRQYVTNVAASYNANPFHNFEHASHVAMAVSKLLSRIVAPADIDPDDSMAELGKALHDHTYGITSDPLTQFACVFSALIHDVDHLGVPNAQLCKEKAEVAERYGNQSVAEQNSVDLAWSLLMEPDYTDLRRAIYTTPAEMQRFRQLVVNSVMATDIVDQNLKALRNARWAKAFSDESALETGIESVASCTNRKATIVIEHVIQAADVSHTMQHWHVYRKWNERFFEECYKAYIEERAETDPSIGWYKGELGFYDFYIIPLAKKLKDCGVFGVSSDECLNYAVRNRKEWEEKGQSIVSEMVERIRVQYPFVTRQVEL